MLEVHLSPVYRLQPPTIRERFMTVHALKSSKVASLRSKVSPEEWQARVDLAAAYRLELSCKTQIAAMSCNTRLTELPADVIEATYKNYQPHVRRPFGVLDWPALLRKLDRIDPGFRD
jgi:hypothetical protein